MGSRKPGLICIIQALKICLGQTLTCFAAALVKKKKNFDVDTSSAYHGEDLTLKTCLLACKDFLLTPASRSASLYTVRSVLAKEITKMGTFLSGAAILVAML